MDYRGDAPATTRLQKETIYVSTRYLPAVEIATGDNPDFAIIWLHGLGADGHDFEPIVPELQLGGLAIRFVFPHAPTQPVTLNGGMAMRSWYDIYSLESTTREDERGIEAMKPAVEALIRREGERGVACERIVLAGFSQGGAMALHVGLRYREQLAGIIGLSTYLPVRMRLKTERNQANADTPIFMAHGNHDPVLGFSFGVASRDLLVSLGHRVEWHEYPMPHAVCPQEIDDLRQWLIERTI
jgi:phospholipase/carboxylesterase